MLVVMMMMGAHDRGTATQSQQNTGHLARWPVDAIQQADSSRDIVTVQARNLPRPLGAMTWAGTFKDMLDHTAGRCNRNILIERSLRLASLAVYTHRLGLAQAVGMVVCWVGRLHGMSLTSTSGIMEILDNCVQVVVAD